MSIDVCEQCVSWIKQFIRWWPDLLHCHLHYPDVAGQALRLGPSYWHDEEAIASDIDNAAKSRESAEKMAAKRQVELQNSRQEAADIVNNAKKSAETQRAQIVEAAQNDAQALKQQAQQDAEQARRDALNGAKDDVANLSIEIASKLIQKELKADDQKELIDSYIEGLVDHESW